MGAAAGAGRRGPGGPWGVFCGAAATNLICLEEFVESGIDDQEKCRPWATSPLRDVKDFGRHSVLEDLIWELFRQHDLSGNDMFEESDLIRLNEKIAEVHHGKDANFKEVREKYKLLYRTKLDKDGKPVDFAKFRTYMLELLDQLDRDEEAQLMMLEQFIAEAYTARQAIDLQRSMGDEVVSVCSTHDIGTPNTSFPPDTLDVISSTSQTGPL
mmetsp:Transcript_129461/g.224857  ORF Transcript_129461/g.224857 Transcript_129461/m.224857 type:complete len:213 (+) Transcript_129461:130-768(+)